MEVIVSSSLVCLLFLFWPQRLPTPSVGAGHVSILSALLETAHSPDDQLCKLWRNSRTHSGSVSNVHIIVILTNFKLAADAVSEKINALTSSVADSKLE